MMLSEFTNAFFSIITAFPFFVLVFGLGFYLYPIYRFKVYVPPKQIGLVLFFIGGLHLYTVFCEVPKKQQVDAITFFQNLEDNGVGTKPYMVAWQNYCVDGVLRMYELSSLWGVVRSALDDAVETNHSFDFVNNSSQHQNFCKFIEAKAQQGGLDD